MSDAVATSAPVVASTRRASFDANKLLRVVLPLALAAAAIWAWESYVTRNAIPAYILPAPSAIWATLIKDWAVLSASLLVTLKTTLEGLVLAVGGGVTLAVLLSRPASSYSLYPYAVVLQVTPVVAISPLLLIYLPQDMACSPALGSWPSFPSCPIRHSACNWSIITCSSSSTSTGRPVRDGRLLRRPLSLASQGLVVFAPTGRPALFSPGLKIAGGLSLDWCGGGRNRRWFGGAGSGLAYRIMRASIDSTFRASSRLSPSWRLRAWRSFSSRRLCPTSSCVIGTRARSRRNDDDDDRLCHHSRRACLPAQERERAAVAPDRIRPRGQP